MGRLDHHEIFEVVGRGGMGYLLRAWDTKLCRIVAIKVLAGPFAASGAARQRFAREAYAAAAVRDDYVVAIYAARDDAPVPYLMMEVIDGCTLESLIRQSGPLEIEEVLRIGIQMASGRAAALRKGVIYRDFKPANRLLERGGAARLELTDFGLARAADYVSLTQSGFIAGTPLYVAPVQLSGKAVDRRSDLFSLGSVLYEMCVGRPAFQASSTAAVLRRVCDEMPRAIREINPNLPEGLCRLIERLHAKNPADRPESAQAVADQLTQIPAERHQGEKSSAGP